VADGGGTVTRLEQALADYLQLRRSLGHQLADAGRLLPGFVGFLDDRGVSTVTVRLRWSGRRRRLPTHGRRSGRVG
jgi:hypothetical protein